MDSKPEANAGSLLKRTPVVFLGALALGALGLFAGVWVLRGEAKVTTDPISISTSLAYSAIPVALLWMRVFLPKSIRERALPRGVVGLSAFVACLGAAWLLADSLETNRLYGDDFEYIGTSRTFARAFQNLFTPHNVHIVPVWRIVTAATIAIAGDLAHLQQTLAAATFGILAATMLLAGRFVARETRSTALGLVATVCMGTTSLMWPAGVWYSAGQATAASLAILIMLWHLQNFRRTGRLIYLLAGSMSALFAAWCWTVGLVAGFVGAAYLAVDRQAGRRRLGGIVPLCVSIVAAAMDLTLGGKGIENQAPISFLGRSAKEAFNAPVGVSHTIQAVVERLMLTGLSVVAELTLLQAAILLAAVAIAWCWTRRDDLLPTPLEAAGASLMLGSSLLLWSFRGYLPFNSLRGFVPWYDVVPYHGLVLFLIGWRAAVAGVARESSSARIRPLTIQVAAWLAAFQCGLIMLHQPRVDQSIGTYLPEFSPSEHELFPIPPLKRLRHRMLAENRANWQREHLVRLDKAQELARREGIGRDVLIKAFGRMIYPDPPYIYDADLLDLPAEGRAVDLTTIRREYGPLFANAPEPRPAWMRDPREPWPPKDAAIGVRRPERP